MTSRKKTDRNWLCRMSMNLVARIRDFIPHRDVLAKTWKINERVPVSQRPLTAVFGNLLIFICCT
jgi:hypothetical protein